MNKHEITQLKQNKPIYIARDLRDLYGVPIEATMEILLKHDVFKWMAVRRELIELKNKIKHKITETETYKGDCKFNLKLNRYCKIPIVPNSRELYLKYVEAKGYQKALEIIQKQIKSLCHSPRWQAPDNDNMAQDFLDRMEV